MTLLDDARRLDNSPLPTDTTGRCWFCDAIPSEEGHRGCPWLAMPRLVAVVEAAERVVERISPVEDGICWGCQRVMDGPIARGHAGDCPWPVLVATLRGEHVSAG